MRGDLHIHMVLDGVYFRDAIDAHRKAPVEALIRQRLQGYAQRGIRFLRDGGDAWGVSLCARELAREYGIDYRSPAFPIYKKGHYGSFIGKGYSDFETYLRLLDETEAKRGDFVKLMISGLIDFSKENCLTEEGLEEEEIFRLVSAAHERGFAVMVHANGDKAVNAALSAGVESVEHGAFLSRETLLRLANSQTLWVPTLSTVGNLAGSGRYPDEVVVPLLKAQQEKVAFVASQGGKIGLGSDAGAWNVPHSCAAENEFSYLQAALGENAERILEEAENFAKEVFQRRDCKKSLVQKQQC